MIEHCIVQAEYFMLEAQVSLQAFCQTMKWKNGLTVAQVNRLAVHYVCVCKLLWPV